MATSTLQQLRIALDTRIPLEAMVLQRLHRLPKGRQNEWLRQLLLVGFRSECQIIKSEQTLPTSATPMRQLGVGSARHVSHGTGYASQQPTEAPANTSMCPHSNERSGPIAKNSANKPFTHLRRVIGE